jgi:hypothetical protein
MTPENWPEPDGLVVELANLGSVSIKFNKLPALGESIYTATQVQEIVRMEVEAIAKLVKAEWMTESDMEYGERLAELILAKLKENKDAD